MVYEKSIWLVISNIGFLINVLPFLFSYCYTEAIGALNVAFWSTIYHICVDMNSCIIFNQTILSYMDFFSSYCYFFILLIFILDIYPRKYKQPLQFILMIIASILTYLQFHPYTYIIYYILSLIFIIINFGLYLSKWIKEKRYWDRLCDLWICDNRLMKWIYSTRQSPFHPVDLISVFFASILVTFAIICQTLDYFYLSERWWLHSLWHIFLSSAVNLLTILYNKKNIISKIYRCLLDKCDKKIDKVMETK